MLFSIVIPVYNVESYLEECMQSILCQVDKIQNDCEILLIDDGSTDSSGEMCDLYASKFPDLVKVYHKENQGLLATRRYGFKRSIGKYIINCDSDDLLEVDALENLYKIIEKYKHPDVVIYNYNSYDGDSKKIAFKDIFTANHDCILKKEEVYKEFLSRQSIVSVCGKMIKRKCIDIDKDYKQFGRISTGEDTLQSIEFFTNAETYVYLNKAVYNYRYGSGMTAKFDKNYYFTFKKIFEEILLKKDIWNLTNFDKLFAVKFLQTTGRAITQSRYNKCISFKEQKKYLKNLRNDSMLKHNLYYLYKVHDELQFDHFIFLLLLNFRFYLMIILLLRIKNHM